MKKLTIKTAILLSKKYARKYKDKIEQEFALVHAQAVVEICLLLTKKLKMKSTEIVTAAWVHDIGSIITREDHSKYSVELLEKEGFTLTPIIKDCILNHGGSAIPKTKEGRVIQAADKIAILNPAVIQVLLKQKKLTDEDFDFLEKMTNGAIKFLKQFD